MGKKPINKKKSSKSNSKTKTKIISKIDLEKEDIDFKIVKEDNSLEITENFKISCSICLNTIKQQGFCSGCFHNFCFFCIKKWSNLSTNCPVCRKDFKNILHNSNSNVEVFKLDEEGKKFQKEKGLIDLAKSKLKKKPFYVLESENCEMIGVKILNKSEKTNNIIQLNKSSLQSDLPEIDIINMTKNENGNNLITRHNYQLAGLDHQEQQLFNKLIQSAVNRSLEEHKETISKINSKSFLDTSKKDFEFFMEVVNKQKTNLVDIYTPDRTRRRPKRNFYPSGQTRYNLRPRIRTTFTQTLF